MAEHGFTFRHHDADDAGGFIDTLVAVQQDVYADAEPREFFSEDRYRRQLAAHMSAPGWALVAARGTDGELAGYAYGFPLQQGTGWWRGLLTPVADGVLEETGARTFAVSELMVMSRWRGQGLGRALHDELLAVRSETRATLLVEPDNARARAAYARWGWTEMARLRPSWEGAPVLEAMILPLPFRR